MIGKQYINPAFLLSVKQQLSTFLETTIHPHLTDLNGSLLGIDQGLEQLNINLKRIAEAVEALGEQDRVQILRNEGGEPW